MKARVIATGEIVRVLQTSNGDYEEFSTHNLYCPDELDFEVTDKDTIYNKGWQDGWDEAVKSEIPKIHPRLKGSDPDYWTRLEHQAAIAAMQGALANNDLLMQLLKRAKSGSRITDIASEFANACARTFVEKLKEKEERK